MRRTFGTSRDVSLAALPGILVALLPHLACPACWPAYAGIMTSLGLGFLIHTAWLFPITVLFLLVAMATFFFRAKHRRGYKPFFLGLSASVCILVGKFSFESNIAMYLRVGLLVTSSVWNGWPLKKYPYVGRNLPG